jgi:hypothetical protein
MKTRTYVAAALIAAGLGAGGIALAQNGAMPGNGMMQGQGMMRGQGMMQGIPAGPMGEGMQGGERAREHMQQHRSMHDDADRDRGHRRDRRASVTAPTLSVADALDVLSREGYTDVTGIERERGNYEAKAKGTDGKRYELRIDGRSGKIVGRERDDD